MTLTTAQKLAQAQAAQKEAIAREEKLREEIAQVQEEQEKNRQEIEALQQRQSIITANVEALSALEPDLFEEIIAIATDARSGKTQQQEQQLPKPEKPEKQLPNIPCYLVDCLKNALEPYCLGIDEVSGNTALLNDHDNPNISPGSLFYKNNQFNPSQDLLNWLNDQSTQWEEMKAEIEGAIDAATAESTTKKAEPDIFESPYKPLSNNVFILIDPENPLQGKVKIAQDMPRNYSVIRHNNQIVLEITTSSGATTVRSNWDWNSRYPKKYQPATRLILKHYAETPELLKIFNEQYPDATDLIAEAEQAKKDLFPSHPNDPDPNFDPVGEGETPGFRLGA